jgi:hypothetical protein
MHKTLFSKLGFRLGPDLTTSGHFSLNMIQKEVFMKTKWLMNLYRTSRDFIFTLKLILTRPFKVMPVIPFFQLLLLVDYQT